MGRSLNTPPGYHSVTARIFVNDADETYRRAINAGATSVEAPLDTPYGDRRGMVRDPFGNVFQIAHRVPGDKHSTMS